MPVACRPAEPLARFEGESKCLTASSPRAPRPEESKRCGPWRPHCQPVFPRRSHTSPEAPGVLDDILQRAGPLPAENARPRTRIRPGRFYVAPPDCHLLVEPGVLRLSKGPREARVTHLGEPASFACHVDRGADGTAV
jgi:hypothetical protein